MNLKGNPNLSFAGRKHSEQTREKMRRSAIGVDKGLAWRGRKHTKEELHKMSVSQKGRISPLRGIPKSEETKRKIGIAQLGKKRPMQSLAQLGEKNKMWKGGITPIHQKIRNSLEYKLWRSSVFERDDWTCRFCHVKGGILQADHIKPFALFPELRFAIDNGRTLCISCHRKTDTYGARVFIRDEKVPF